MDCPVLKAMEYAELSGWNLLVLMSVEMDPTTVPTMAIVLLTMLTKLEQLDYLM